jgi:hypothetical protein
VRLNSGGAIGERAEGEEVQTDTAGL